MFSLEPGIQQLDHYLSLYVQKRNEKFFKFKLDKFIVQAELAGLQRGITRICECCTVATLALYIFGSLITPTALLFTSFFIYGRIVSKEASDRKIEWLKEQVEAGVTNMVVFPLLYRIAANYISSFFYSE